MSDQMLKDWAWRLERAIHSGHHCDATIAADAVMQSIKAELKRRATAALVVVGEDMVTRACMAVDTFISRETMRKALAAALAGDQGSQAE